MYKITPQSGIIQALQGNLWHYGWELHDSAVSYADAKGGLVLKNMLHDQYSFVLDCRVIGIWIIPTDPQYKPEYLILGPPDFDIVDSHIPSTNVSQAPFNFNVYNTIQQLDVTYESRQSFFGLSEPVRVIQKYLFTDYSDSPVHEPAGYLGNWIDTVSRGYVPWGALTATRFFPLVQLNLPQEYQGKVQSFRVDYRFHPKIDGFVNQAQNIRGSSSAYPNGLFDFPNQAGLFLDGIEPYGDILRMLGEGGAALIKGMSNVFTGSSHDTNIAQGVFLAVEKPLLLEVCTTGIKDSQIKFPSESTDPAESGKNRYHWDNIHWWGSRGKGNDIISAIGAFHTFHLHWRWGYGGQWAPAGNQFEGINRYVSGPLVDPRLPKQTVRLAVTKYNASLDPNLVSLKQLSKENFSDLFNKGGPPQPIDKENAAKFEGDNLVLWYSVEAQVPDNFSEGIVFIHGIFFAHENEPMGNPLTGSRTPEYWPLKPADIRRQKKWYRPHD